MTEPRSSSPRFLGQQDVEALHDAVLAGFGGLAGTRDEGLLQSALSRPENKWHYADPGSPPDLFDLAAAYGFGLARNHPFNGANKRTASAASLVFLYLKGVDLDLDQMELVETFVSVAPGGLGEAALAAWFRWAPRAA